MQKGEKKVIPQKYVTIAGGVVLLLASIFLFLAPSTHLYFFDYLQVYLFGNPGFYGINILLGLLGVYCFVSPFKQLPKPALTRLYFGYLFLFLACCLLCSILSPITVSFDSPSAFNEIISNISLGKGFGVEASLGGGIFGYFLLSLCQLSSFKGLAVLVVVILFIISFLFWGWNFLGRAFISLRSHLEKRKSDRRRSFLEEVSSLEEKEEDSSQEENEAVFEEEGEEEEIGESSFKEIAVKEEKAIDSPFVTIRRKDYQSRLRASEEPEPEFVYKKSDEKEKTKILEPVGLGKPFSLAPSNMKEAVFSFDEEEETPAFGKEEAPAFEKEETPVAPINSSPHRAPKEEVPQSSFDMDSEPTLMEEEISPKEDRQIDPGDALDDFFVPDPIEEKPKPEMKKVETAPKKKEPVLGEFDISMEDKLAQQKYLDADQKKKEEETMKASIRYINFGEDRVKVANPNQPPYHLPDPNEILLDYPPDSNMEANIQEAEERKQRINLVLSNFHIQAECVDYIIGPSVTRYYISLGPTTQIRQIRGIIETLQVQMGGVHGLFRDMIKGSPYCGLEVANSKTALVSFKECVLGIPDDNKHKLYVPFGKSIEGNIVSASVAKFPHMLVAGGTGSGKSIFVHGIVSTLLMHNTPDELKFLFIDKKRIELGKYEGIPHLLCPVIKEATEAKKALDKLVDEMNRRNRILDAAGRVSDIDEFNEDVAPVKGCEKFPHIVAIIDEYADLVDTCKEVNEPVARLTQLARSAGIHLIVATQHPTVDVINGRIKSNIGTRVGLKVTNATDSMTVLNAGGAEKLNGHGDMLVDCMEVNEPGVFMRLQGCLINKKEIAAIVETHASQRPFVCDPEFENLHEEEPMENSTDFAMPTAAENRAASEDQLYQQIKEAVMKREYVSISAFQREYGLGFGKAGRLFDRLKKEGIVEANGTSNKGSRVLLHDYVSNEGN